jgi:hypothetical protein
MCEETQKKQREHLREWDLAASLAELAGDSVAGVQQRENNFIN